MNLKPLTPRPQATESIGKILRLPAVLQATGLARSTVYRMMAEHTFPAPIKLAKRAVGDIPTRWQRRHIKVGKRRRVTWEVKILSCSRGRTRTLFKKEFSWS